MTPTTPAQRLPDLTTLSVAAEIDLTVARIGSGPPILLVHGFPHTWQIWRDVIPPLARNHRVIAPDLRGFGASTATDRGLDAQTLAHDLALVLERHTEPGEAATVVATDAGVAPAFLLALDRPDLVDRLVLIEGTIGALPGAEAFFTAPPWWFGFHAVPGLAERVLAGNEAAYVDFFLDIGAPHTAIAPELRSALRAAYTRADGLKGPMAYYRALQVSAQQIVTATVSARLTMPTLAIGAAPVGQVLADQLAGVADRLDSELIADCGHIVAVEKPERLAQLILGHQPAEPGRSPHGDAGSSALRSTPSAAMSRLDEPGGQQPPTIRSACRAGASRAT